MMLSVDPGIPLPVYEQIREQIVRMVAGGTLQPGHRLPTIRQLAADLGLAKGTVAKAYELLESDAIIATRGRKGSFILHPPRVTATERTEALAQAAESLVVAARQLGAELDEAHRALDDTWHRL